MNALIAKLKVLHDNDKDDEVYNLVEEQLKHESDDVEMWLSLALIIYSVPIVDQYKAIECLEKVLAIDENNAIALIILTYVYEHSLGGIDDELLHKIETLDAGSPELNSMLKYVASWSYAWHKKKDPLNEEKLLKESIQFYSNYVWDYIHLAWLYFGQNRDAEAHLLVQKALKNVQYIYPDEKHEHDVTNVNEFLNERVKGIYLTSGNLNSIKELLDKTTNE